VGFGCAQAARDGALAREAALAAEKAALKAGLGGALEARVSLEAAAAAAADAQQRLQAQARRAAPQRSALPGLGARSCDEQGWPACEGRPSHEAVVARSAELPAVTAEACERRRARGRPRASPGACAGLPERRKSFRIGLGPHAERRRAQAAEAEAAAAAAAAEAQGARAEAAAVRAEAEAAAAAHAAAQAAAAERAARLARIEGAAPRRCFAKAQQINADRWPAARPHTRFVACVGTLLHVVQAS